MHLQTPFTNDDATFSSRIRSVVVCIVSYTAAVTFSIYGVFVNLFGLTLVFFGNAIVVAFMNGSATALEFLTYPTLCIFPYLVLRSFTKSWSYAAVIASLNWCKQIAVSLLMRKYMPLTDANINKSFKLIWVTLLSTGVMSVLFAFLETIIIHMTLHDPRPYKDFFLTLCFSQFCGSFLGLYAYYVMRGVRRTDWCDVKYAIDMCALVVVTTLLNYFSDYGFFTSTALVICFPLMCIIAVRHSQRKTLVAQFVTMGVVFTLTLLHKGQPNNHDPQVYRLVGLYVLLLCSSVMTFSLSIVMMRWRESVEKVTTLKDELFFVSSQVSHDVRGPLNHILLLCESVLETHLDDEEIVEMRSSCETIIGIMNSWLTVLQVSGQKIVDEESALLNNLEVQDMSVFGDRFVAYAKGTLRYLNKPGLRFVYEAAASVPDLLFINEKLLFHTVINFISNAIKYSETGTVRVASTFADGFLTIRVSDEGIGIAAKDLEHIFEPFYRVFTERFEKGHGIGLSIVETLARRMGGTVRVESVLGEGSTFSIRAPAVIADDASPERTPWNWKDKIIVIAEDDDACRRLYTIMIRDAGGVVHSVSKGDEVVNVVDRTSPDVLLLDHGLPSRTGFEILTYMQRHPRYSRILIITISGHDLIASKKWHPLLVTHCPKPFRFTQLNAAVQKCSMRLKEDA